MSASNIICKQILFRNISSMNWDLLSTIAQTHHLVSYLKLNIFNMEKRARWFKWEVNSKQKATIFIWGVWTYRRLYVFFRNVKLQNSRLTNKKKKKITYIMISYIYAKWKLKREHIPHSLMFWRSNLQCFCRPRSLPSF